MVVLVSFFVSGKAVVFTLGIDVKVFLGFRMVGETLKMGFIVRIILFRVLFSVMFCGSGIFIFG